MATLVLDPEPLELRELRERRHRLGQDRFDEVWGGVYHMKPAPGYAHAVTEPQVLALLHAAGRAAGLTPIGQFNLGGREDYRVPDGGLLCTAASGAPVYLSTAALVVEIVSPGDESFDKLPFYAEHGVGEVLVVDPQQRQVRWLALREGAYAAVEHSALVDLGRAQLASQIDWP